jgi:hypothetical protein
MQNKVNFIDDINAVLPNATTAAKMPNKQPKRQSLDDARAKVVAKALRSKTGYVAVDDDESTERIYKFNGSKNKYAVGLKCGNRWIDHKLFDGESYIYVDTEAEIDTIIDLLVEWTEAGHFDETIEAVMHNNNWRANKK